MVRKHELGIARPGARYRRAYTLLYTPEAGADGPPGADAGVPSPRGAAHPDRQEGGDPTDRRGLIGWVAAALGAPAGLLPELTSDDRLAVLDRAGFAAGAVTAAEGALQTIVGDYLSLPPGAVLDRVAALQRLTDAVQAEYLLKPADTARLWKVAAVAAGIRGWLENNAGDTKAARASLREAHRRGELIDDDRLIAWARLMQATVEKYAGNPTTAERYALDGLRHTTKHSPQRAHFLEGIAGYRAARGDLGGVDAAVGEAGIIVTGLSPEQRGPDANRIIVDDMTTYSPTAFASGTGHAYALLGRPDRFDEVTADACAAAERDGTYLRLFFRTDRALAVLRSVDPDPEKAAELAQGGLEIADSFQTAHAGSRLDLILEAAKPFDTHPAVVDLAECSAAWRADRGTSSVADS
jgi:hypothetical protein